MATRVKISLFKPEGFEDTHYVEADDRGAAAVEILAKYSKEELAYLNYIECSLCSMPKHPITKRELCLPSSI